MAVILTTKQQKKIGRVIADAQAQGHTITWALTNSAEFSTEDRMKAITATAMLDKKLTELYYLTEQDK